jgi:hypothetical protein
MFSPNPNSSSSKEQRTTKSQKPQRSIIHHPLPRICCHSIPPCVIRPPSCFLPLFFLCITALVVGPRASPVPDNQRPVFKEIKFSASWTESSSRATVSLDLLCFVKEKQSTTRISVVVHNPQQQWAMLLASQRTCGLPMPY